MRNKAMAERSKILIVDDEPFNVDYLEQELGDLGYETVSATNGKEALQKVAVEAPDLILLDVRMPGIDGFTVCRLLKEREETQLIPLVMMTALGALEDRIRGIEAGADDFLTKPVNPRELLARIQTAVKMKQAVDRRLKEQREREREKGEGPVEQPTVPNKLFHRDGEYWTIAYQGEVFRIKDTVGLRYLAYLLRYPHKPIHVLELVAFIEGPTEAAVVGSGEERDAAALAEFRVQAGLGDAGEILDPKAKAAYKQRLEELRAELEGARAYNDLGRVDKIQEEIDFLTQEIISGVGLGGRDRRAASPAERARVNVTRAIKAALQKLSSHSPALGHDLTSTINTGMFCSYTPDLHLPSPWQL
jgi:DNA-binding response OmpR family regulator